jgi:hypothetical protein
MNHDEFFKAYVQAALWSSNDESDEPLDQNYDESDLSDSARTSMREDCEVFLSVNRIDLVEYESVMPRREWSTSAQAGHDFWLTRNHHGTGFWDRGIGALGDRLTRAAQSYPEVHLYVNDDEEICCE